MLLRAGYLTVTLRNGLEARTVDQQVTKDVSESHLHSIAGKGSHGGDLREERREREQGKSGNEAHAIGMGKLWAALAFSSKNQIESLLLCSCHSEQ